MDQKANGRRNHYLSEFKRENSVDDLFSSDNAESTGKRIVDLMKKEDLTHDEAYASLQYAYNLIKFESNFLKLN